MNIYARIRKIEDQQQFSLLINALFTAEYKTGFQTNKDWKDYGVDGYVRSEKAVIQIYCPKYPERASQKNYTKKIREDTEKLSKAIDKDKKNLKVHEWWFVTPDDLSREVIDFLEEKSDKCGWQGKAVSAFYLGLLFSKHPDVHFQFPDLKAGLDFDKAPSVYVRTATFKGYDAFIEVFNDGTEDIKEFSFQLYRDSNWEEWNNKCHFEHDNPASDSLSTCYTLKKGERRYIGQTKLSSWEKVRITGIGVESQRSFFKEFDVEHE